MKAQRLVSQPRTLNTRLKRWLLSSALQEPLEASQQVGDRVTMGRMEVGQRGSLTGEVLGVGLGSPPLPLVGYQMSCSSPVKMRVSPSPSGREEAGQPMAVVGSGQICLVGRVSAG